MSVHVAARYPYRPLSAVERRAPGDGAHRCPPPAAAKQITIFESSPDGAEFSGALGGWIDGQIRAVPGASRYADNYIGPHALFQCHRQRPAWAAPRAPPPSKTKTVLPGT